MSLFRSAAVEQQRQKFYGTILLARPLSFAWLTGFFALVTLAVILFFCLAGFTRKEAVTGVLLPEHGLMRVYPAQPGLLVQSKVRDGQAVRQGDILFVLSGERSSSLKGDTQSAVGRSLTTRIERLHGELGHQQLQARQQQEALVRRRRELQEQLAQIGTEISGQQKRLQLAEAAAQRFADLQKSNYVSAAQVQDKTADVLDQQSRLHALERGRSALRVSIDAASADLADLPLRTQRESSALAREVAELDESVAENEARRQIVVRAPGSGIVTAINADPGQLLAVNQALASIIPADGKLEAELYAPSHAIGFVRPGTRVLLRYQAFPYQKFGQYGGTVSEISNAAVAPREIGAPLAREALASDPLYRIRVKLDRNSVQVYGSEQALKPGMQLEASLVLEHRKLYEWVIEPLISITGKL